MARKPSSSNISNAVAHSGAAGRAKNASSNDRPHTRVLCVDDHALLVEGLKAQFAIDREIECIGSLENAARLLDEVARLNPDVVMLDIDMPGPDVFEMADRLHHLHPH